MDALKSALCRLLMRASMAVALLALSLPGSAMAQGSDPATPIERQVKAAYIYKFANFVEWPDGIFARSDTPLVIGVAGADAIADELERVAASQAGSGRPVSVRRLRRADQVAGVHILFIGAVDKGVLVDILAASRRLPVLSVTESDEAHALGSVLNFVIANNKVRFEVALKAAGQNHLRISARMLSVAFKVAPG